MATQQSSGFSVGAGAILRSSGARVAFAVLYAAQAFYMMPFLVGHLGDHWYGIWVLVTGLLSSSYLLDLGLATAVSRFMAKSLGTGDTRGANEVINTSLAIYAGLALAVFGFAVVLALMAPRWVEDPAALSTVRMLFIVLGFTYAADFPFKAFAGITSTYMRYDLLMASRLFNVVLITGGFVYLLSRGYGLVAMATTTMVVNQISSAIYFLIARHLFREMRLDRSLVRRSLVPELFSYSIWSLIIQIAHAARFSIDALVIAWAISATAVTYYTVAVRLVDYFVDMIYKATNFMVPVFTVAYYGGQSEELRRKYFLVLRITAVMACFGCGMIIMLGKPFILRWMGPNFAQSYPVLVILVVTMMFEVVGTTSDSVLFAASRHRYLAYIHSAEAAVNFVISLALVKPYGLVGVAVGTAIPLLVTRIAIIPTVIARLIGVPVWTYYRTLLPIAAFTALYLTGAALMITQPDPPTYIWILSVSAVLTPPYLLAIWMIAFDRSERAVLLELVPLRARFWVRKAA